MNTSQMLAKALEKLKNRGLAIETRKAYYDGLHPMGINSADWDRNWRNKLSGLIDNQCALIVDITAEAVVPQAFEPRTASAYDAALCLWASERLTDEAARIVEAIRTAEWSGTQTTVAVDWDAEGEVTFFLLDPRSTYVEIDGGGAYLWAVHFWIDENTGFTHATVYTPTETLHMESTSKVALAKATDFTLAEEPIPNPHGELMLATVDKRRSIIDRLAPQQDLLNKSLQTQAVAGEAYALPLRIFLGIETYNEETGLLNDVIPALNPATGSRNVTLPTAGDGHGGERKVIQLESPKPGEYLTEQDSYRANMARLGSVPAFMLQLGTGAVSGDALEMVYLPHLAAKAANERICGPFLARLGRLSIQRYLYKLTGRHVPAPALRTVFSTVSTSTTSSRVEQMASAISSGMTLADALVHFMGMTPEAAAEIEGRSIAAADEKAARTARTFDAGI